MKSNFSLCNIPILEFRGLLFLETLKPPYVLKADGLAAGKGVLIIDDINEAKQELKSMLGDGKFGKAGEKVVIEEFLKGIELSVFVLTDGKNYKLLPSAKDYKRIGEGDTGLNTGGMGAVSPVPFADAAFIEKVENNIVKPTIAGLTKDNIDYKGFIFIGLIFWQILCQMLFRNHLRAFHDVFDGLSIKICISDISRLVFMARWRIFFLKNCNYLPLFVNLSL